jgi:integrase
MTRHRDLAEGLRTYLEVAGVTRADLHTADATRKAMTFHDLRATGLTWLAIRGDDPLKIKQGAGHSAFTTTEGYIRAEFRVQVFVVTGGCASTESPCTDHEGPLVA